MPTSQAKKALRRRRKENGLCIYCGEQAIPTQTRCQRCSARDKENRKRQAARDAKRGICKNTGCSNTVEQGRGYCAQCNQSSGARTLRRRQARVARGVCAYCDNPVATGLTRCAACNARLRERVRALQDKRVAEGKCGRCGDNVLATGYKQCQSCIDKGRQRHADRKRRVIDAYGGPQCQGCPENDIRILQIDHVDGGGHRHALQIGDGRASIGRGKMYKWLEDHGFPEGFRVLCPNCNIRAKLGIPLPSERES